MGAYLVLYPRARVHTLFFFFIFFRVIPVPAWIILGYWFLIQLLSSTSGPGGRWRVSRTRRTWEASSPACFSYRSSRTAAW